MFPARCPLDKRTAASSLVTATTVSTKTRETSLGPLATVVTLGFNGCGSEQTDRTVTSGLWYKNCGCQFRPECPDGTPWFHCRLENSAGRIKCEPTTAEADFDTATSMGRRVGLGGTSVAYSTPASWQIEWRDEADEAENYVYAIALQNDI